MQAKSVFWGGSQEDILASEGRGNMGVEKAT